MKSWGIGDLFSSWAVPAGLQKRLISYLLQRAIGHFLEDNLDLENLDIALSDGTLQLSDLRLNTRTLNEFMAGTPLAVKHGRIGRITTIIPWRNLWSGQCSIDIEGIDITLVPAQVSPSEAHTHVEHLFDSMELANDFTRQQQAAEKAGNALHESLLQSFQSRTTEVPSGIPGDFNSRPMNPSSIPTASLGEGDRNQDGEGTQLVARLIEVLLARIKVTCRDTTVRLHHQSDLPLIKPRDGAASKEKTDYELEIRLPYISYSDRTKGRDDPSASMSASSFQSRQGTESLSGSTNLDPSVIWEDSPDSVKAISFRGFSIWIRQQGGIEELLTEVNMAPKNAFENVQESIYKSFHESVYRSQGDSIVDSDSECFQDAQETLQSPSGSMMASQVVPPLLKGPHIQSPSSELYEAKILSTPLKSTYIDIKIRKNATIKAGSTSQGPTTVTSLLDIDLTLKHIFVALSPNQIAFILEILALMESPSSTDNLRRHMRAEDEQAGNPDLQDFIQSHEVPSRDRYLETPMNDSYMERPLTQGQRSSSSRATHQTSSLAGVQSRNQGGRHLAPDRHPADMRPNRMNTPSMMDSRFLGDSVYLDPQSANVPSGVLPSQTVKLKARISTFQVYVLFKDPESRQNIPTDDNFYRNPTPEVLRAGHLKLELDGMVLGYRKWTSSNATMAGQRGAKQSKAQIDFTLKNITLSEWIESGVKLNEAPSFNWTADRYRTPPRGQYIPIIEFDTDQESLLQKDRTSKFPVLKRHDRYCESTLLSKKRQNEQVKSATTSKSDPSVSQKDTPSGTTTQVVRLRVHFGGKNENTPASDSASATSSSSYATETTIEVKPMQVHIDFHMFKRMEKCLLAIMGPEKQASSPLPDHHANLTSRPPRPTEQINDDFEERKTAKAKSKLRLRLNSVQLWVSIPDMAATLERKADRGPEYRSIHDMLSVNITKLVFTHVSDNAKGATSHKESNDLKLKAEFTSLSAFVLPANDKPSKAFLLVGSVATTPSTRPVDLPYLEITLRSPNSLPVQFEQRTSSELPLALNAFAAHEAQGHHTVDVDEEGVHNADVDDEELHLFKQRTLETSLTVIDAQVPLVALQLQKEVLDNLLFRINDISTWLAIFSGQLDAQIPKASMSSPETGDQDQLPKESAENAEEFTSRRDSFDDGCQDDRRTSFDEEFRDDHSEHGTDRSTLYGEELRRQAEGKPAVPRTRASRAYLYRPMVVKPTMASVLIAVQTVEVVFDYLTKPTPIEQAILKTYQINIGEARVFAASKYQGGNETYATVDAEDLEAWEITSQRPKVLLITRTIPKTVKLKSPRPMVHLTSQLSFDPVRKFKDNVTNLAFSGISWKFTIDQTAVDDVQDFFTEPQGIIYLDPPGQCTRISVSLFECGLDYKPLHIPSRFVLTFEKMKVFSTLIPESPTLNSKVQIYNMSVFLIDHVQSIANPHHPGLNSPAPGIDSRQFWRSLGFALIGQCLYFELKSIKSKTGKLPLYDLTITNNVFYLETCSDSFQTILQLAGYLADNGDMPIEKKRILEILAESERSSNRERSHRVNSEELAASIDEQAFRPRRPQPQSLDGPSLDFDDDFYTIEADQVKNMYSDPMSDTGDVEGFHEVHSERLSPQPAHENQSSQNTGRSRGRAPQAVDEEGSMSMSRIKTSTVLATSDAEDDIDWTLDFSPAPTSKREPKVAISHPSSMETSRMLLPEVPRRSTLETPRRDGHARQSGRERKEGRVKKEAEFKEIITTLDPDISEFKIVENYFSVPVLTEEEIAKDKESTATIRIRVRDFNFCWRLYDGLDWEISRVDEAERKRQARQLAKRLQDPNDPIHASMDPQSNMEAGVFERLSGLQHRRSLSHSSSDVDSVSDYQPDITSQPGGVSGRTSSSSSRSGSRRPTHQASQPSLGGIHHDSQKRRKKLERSAETMIEFSAEKIRVDFEDYAMDNMTNVGSKTTSNAGFKKASHLSLRVRQFEIIDNVKTSLWHKFLSLQRHDTHTATPHLTQSNMVRIDLDGVRPIPTVETDGARPVPAATTVDYRLKVRILPVRLYVDQDALMFLIKFFVQGAQSSSTPSEEAEPDNRMAGPNATEKKKPNEMYFQSVRMGELSVKVDYKPKHVDYTGLTGGNFIHGVNGFARLAHDLIAAWLPHIRSTQVPHMVSGLTPIRSLVNVGSGIADLVILPIEQYKRDGHIIRGLQRGGRAFTKATALEALKIGTKLAVGTQVLLEHADDVFGSSTDPNASSSSTGAQRGEYMGEGGPSGHGSKRMMATMVSDTEAFMEESFIEDGQLPQYLQEYGHSGLPDGAKPSRISKYANQPVDINEGMEHAYKSLSKNIGTAAHTIFAVPMEVYEQTGAQGSARAVIRAVPVAVLKPMIGATEAFSKVLIGLRNSIDPEQRLLTEDKYKKH
ncbi:autophagy- protein 2 [Mortierella sp. GBA43]|nr:autophagy- protein 2 [Mortierella sp. GBA43]